MLLRPGPAGLEVLLTQRPSTMAFAPNVHVFPGGAQDPADGDLVTTALRELFEEVGVLLADRGPAALAMAAARRALLAREATLRDLARVHGLALRPDRLAPLSRWITPPQYPNRFDATFFAAELPDGVRPAFDRGEIVGHRWETPSQALEAMAAGEIELWPPTSITIQQLEHVRSFEEIRTRLAPGEAPSPLVERVAPAVVRVEVGGAGAVPGQRANTWLVGRREIVVVDPGDPGEAAVAALGGAVGEGRIVAIVLTHPDPDHAAASHPLAERLGVPVYGGSRAGRPLGFAVTELGDGERVPAGDVGLVAVHAPGPRPEHIALAVEGDGLVLAGDLVGGRASRAVLGPPDIAAWGRSLRRLAALDPRRLLPGHGPVIEDVATALSRSPG